MVKLIFLGVVEEILASAYIVSGFLCSFTGT